MCIARGSAVGVTPDAAGPALDHASFLTASADPPMKSIPTLTSLPRLGSLLLLAAATLPACRGTTPPARTGLAARVPVKAFLNFPPDLPEPGFRAVPAFRGVTFDWAVRAVYERASNRYVVIEREGRVWAFPNDEATRDKALLLDLTQRTQGYYDCGLLGIALHPQYGRRGSPHESEIFVWYNYSDRPQGSREQRPRYRTPSFNRLSRFHLPPGARRIDPASEVVLIDQYDETTFHEGGAMFFHPDDGFLYLTLGDDFIDDNAQRLDRSLFSGVIRIDVDADPRRSHPIRRHPRNARTAHYAVPEDNPFVDPQGGALEEFWALGLRSPHTMSLDRRTGRIFLADVGHMAREELNLIVKGGNYEWPFREGAQGGEPAHPVIGERRAPILDYAHEDGNNCIIGGFVYRGQAHPELAGRFLLGDNGSNRVWALPVDGERAGKLRQIARIPGPTGYVGGLSSFAEDAQGEPLLVRVGARMPLLRLAPGPRDRAALPATLAQTGLFADVAALTPAPGVVRYEVNLPHWADGARAAHWIALPSDGESGLDPEREQITFGADGEWRLPQGSVLAQQLDLPLDARRPEHVRRVETRVLVHSRRGEFYALSYRWRADGREADLVARDAQDVEEIETRDAQGRAETVAWRYPSRAQCRQCHNGAAGGALGLSARQLEREIDYGAGRESQMAAWAQAGMLARAPATVAGERLAPLGDARESLEHRVRSYLDVNCAPCHRPDGARALFDARRRTPLAQSGILGGEVLNPLGMQGARVVTPGDPATSLLLFRLHSVGAIAMPPVGKARVDLAAAEAVTRWIEELGAARR
jgi:uncharacterized repeat protein (TIGR03806 family)